VRLPSVVAQKVGAMIENKRSRGKVEQ